MLSCVFMEVIGAVHGLRRACRVPTIDGDVEVSLKPGTQHGDVLRVGGKGVSRGLAGSRETRGDQLVHLSIQLPRHLSARQRELLEQFRRESEANGWNYYRPFGARDDS